MPDVSTLVAIVVGVIAIIAPIASGFYWKGQTDASLKACKDLPSKTQALQDKMDILWKIFVEQTLKGAPNLAEHHSPYKLTAEGEQCLAKLDGAIGSIMLEHTCINPSDVLILLSNKIGQAEFDTVVENSGCTRAEFYSVLTIKLGINL